MEVRISKALEGVLARTAFDTARSGMDHSLKDCLMLALLRDDDSMAYRLLAGRLQDWQMYQIRLRLERDIRRAPSEGASPEEFFVEYAQTLRKRFSDVRRVSTAHAAIDIIGDSASASARIFGMYGITAAELEDELAQLSADAERTPITTDAPISTPLATDATLTQESSLIKRFGTDLTRAAREGALDPVIGREREIERVVQILARRKKNNPILVGEAGVGKSAIIEGLALRIATGNIPTALADKNIVTMDVASLVAGTKFRGEFEERMQLLLDEMRRNRQTILFIDEIHTIVGAGSTQGSLDTANILKPALARGEVRIIGATTLDEFRECIESDAALERRFGKIVIEPPTSDETLSILHTIAPIYEQHHAVRYSPEALSACVTLAERYITERHFPDKAIDLLDESGASLALSASEVRPATVTADNVAHCVAVMTGIPVERLRGDEQQRVRDLEKRLSERVIGQSDAIGHVAKAIRRARMGLRDEHRPMGVFLFVGPTGVGKTLLAKELARQMNGNAGIVRIDMSEYSEPHTVARLFGSPPGYVGYGEGGQLTEAVRRKPYSVVLIDEVEKAHPTLFDTFLQVLDEGHMTDGSGRKVDFRNTIIIMTSNVGSRDAIQGAVQMGYATTSKHQTATQQADAAYRKALERTFSPEFIGRIDEIVFFRELSNEDVQRIIDLELRHTLHRLERMGYTLRITAKARRELASLTYKRAHGVRALKRVLAEQVEEPLSTLLLEGEVMPGVTIVVDGSSCGIKVRAA